MLFRFDKKLSLLLWVRAYGPVLGFVRLHKNSLLKVQCVYCLLTSLPLYYLPLLGLFTLYVWNLYYTFSCKVHVCYIRFKFNNSESLHPTIQHTTTTKYISLSGKQEKPCLGTATNLNKNKILVQINGLLYFFLKTRWE